MKDHTRRRYRDEPEEAAPQPKRKSPSSRRKRSNARARISLYNRTEICQHALLIIPIVLAGALTFHYSSGMLKSEFSREFEHVTDQVARESTYRLRNQHNFLETLSLSVTSSTLSQQWPLITIPDFKNLALNYRRISHSQVIAFSPLVSASNQTTWEEYSKGNGITPYIYRKEGSDRVRFYSNPYSLPFWQASPDEGAGSINNNLLYTSWVKSLVEASLESKDAMLSEPLHPEFLFAVFPNAKAQESKEKWSILVQPIRIAPKENTDPNADSEIGGFLFSMLPWSSFLRDILWNTDESVICVIRDNLNYAFSYQLKGSEALYLGEGDSFHDPKWHPDHVETTPFTIDTNGSSSNVSSRELQYGSSYTYTLEVYPTSEFYNYYVTEEPWIYTTIVVAIFVAVALWFLSCDCCKKYRENRIKDTEERTMDYSTTQTINHRASRPNRKSALPENNKQRLNQFLVDTSAPNKQNGEEKEEHTDFSGDNLDWDSKPVADFFPSATGTQNDRSIYLSLHLLAFIFGAPCTYTYCIAVMMADLTHFTAWSSIREPAQIFFL